jgi:hypothetical protein
LRATSVTQRSTRSGISSSSSAILTTHFATVGIKRDSCSTRT